jgi:hypothetical protein
MVAHERSRATWRILGKAQHAAPQPREVKAESALVGIHGPPRALMRSHGLPLAARPGIRADLRKQDLHHGCVPLGRCEVQRSAPTNKTPQYTIPCGALGVLHAPFSIDRDELSSVAHTRLRTG